MPNTILCTDDRRRIHAHLQAGGRAYIQHSCRVVDLATGDDLGTQIAALELIEGSLARWVPGCEWVIEGLEMCGG